MDVVAQRVVGLLAAVDGTNSGIEGQEMAICRVKKLLELLVELLMEAWKSASALLAAECGDGDGSKSIHTLADGFARLLLALAGTGKANQSLCDALVVEPGISE